MAGSIYELAILLTLKDAASGGLGRVEDRLRATGKTGRATLQTFQDLRSELKKDLTIAGVGVASLMALRGGVKVAGDYEASMADLRMSIEELGTDGKINLQKLGNEFNQLESVGVRLGNKLPGTTQDFIEMFSTLKQGGLDAKTIIDGAGESVAHLAVVTGEIPKDLAEPFAQYAQQFSLTGGEAIKLADTLARIRFATGLRPQELIEGSKFFQLRAGMALKFTGLEGADVGGRLLATLRSFGLEGGIGGRELGGFMLSLNFNTKDKQKLIAELKDTKGIDLKFFDDKGAFLGVENVFKQMEKFRGLSTQDQMKFGEKLFDREGMAIASIFMKSGVEGWNKINQRIDKVPPLQELINQKTATYNAKLEAVKGTLTNLEATAFAPMLDVLKPILDQGNKLAGSLQEWSKVNPEITKTVGLLVGMGSITLTVYGGIRAMTTAWRMWRIASSVGVSEAGQLTFLRTLRTEAGATSTSLGVATTKARGLRSTLGGIPAQIGVMIALEYTIAKGFELYQEMQNYKEAQAGEQRANVMGAKSLTAVESDYKKRGEPVPSDVYRGRASVALESLNRGGQLRESLEPGSHILRETARFFSFQQPNPYAGTFGNFEPRSAVSDFRQRAPELGNADVMRAFIAELGKFKLPAEQQGQFGLAEIQRKEISQTLQAAFPESYQQATLSVTKGLTDMQQPLTVFPTSLDKAGASAARLAGSFDRFSNRLAGFELPTFTGITFGGQSAPGTAGGSPASSSAPSHPYQVFPSKAAGGLVLKGGFVEVHDREAIVPARVTDKWTEMRTADRGPLAVTIVAPRSEPLTTRSGLAGGTVPQTWPPAYAGGSGKVWPPANPERVGSGSDKTFSNLRSEMDRSGTRVNELRFSERDSATTREVNNSLVSQFSNLRSEMDRSVTRVNEQRFSERDSSTSREVDNSSVSQFSNLRSDSRVNELRFSDHDSSTTREVNDSLVSQTSRDVRQSMVSQFSNLRSEAARAGSAGILPAGVSAAHAVRADALSAGRMPALPALQLTQALREVALTPERVQVRPEVARSVLTSPAVDGRQPTAGASARPVQVTVHYSPNITIQGGNPQQVAQQVQAVMAQHSQDLAGEVMRMVEHSLEIQMERA